MNTNPATFDIDFTQGEHKHFIRIYRELGKANMRLYVENGEGDAVLGLTCEKHRVAETYWHVDEFTHGRSVALKANNEAEALIAFCEFARAWIDSHGTGPDPFVQQAKK
jgi:hypothetical protein